MDSKRCVLTQIVLFLGVLTVNGSIKDNETKENLFERGGKYYLKNGEVENQINEKVITVKLKDGKKGLNKDFSVLRSAPSGYIDLSVPEEKDILDYKSELESCGLFEVVKYVELGKSFFTPNDSHLTDQWYLGRINMHNAWNVTKGDPNIKVAVIDHEVDWQHIDIGNGYDGYKNIDGALGYNYLAGTSNLVNPTEHGTLVAGIIGAKTNNYRGIAGICGGNNCSGTTIIPYCVSYMQGTNQIDMSKVDDAIYDAIDKGVKVINISVGIFNPSSTIDVDAAIDSAYNRGITIVAAVGNIENNNFNIAYPASNTKVIGVGSIGKNDLRCSDSCYGNGIDISAPGEDIYSTTLYNNYESEAGTSMAAPQVSGTVALMYAINPYLSPSKIYAALTSTASKIGNYNYDSSGWHNYVGYGLLDAYAAIKAVELNISGELIPCPSGIYTVENLPDSCSVTWALPGTTGLLTQNMPLANQCTVSNNGNSSFSTNLIAYVWHNGQIIKTLTKHIQSHITTATFSQTGTIYQGTTYPDIPPTEFPAGSPICVNPRCIIKVSAPYFENMTFIHTGASPNFWGSVGNDLLMRFPYSSSIQTMNVSGTDGCRSFSFIVRVYPEDTPLILEAIGNNNGYDISLISQDEVGERNQSQRSQTFEWNIDIRNAETGNIVYEGVVVGKTISINTVGWPSGIYIVHAMMNGQEATCKITVK